MGRTGAFRIRRGALIGLIGVLALTLAACFRPPRPQPPVAAFSVSTAPLVASFTEESTGAITSRSWDFGDGGTSTESNPTHDYDQWGDYPVTLTVTGPGGTDTETQTVSIKPPPPEASFAAQPQSGTIPLTVTVANTSTGLVDAVAWDLDGNGVFNDATGQTATRTFDTAGSHTIGLAVTGPGGTSTTSQTVVANLPPPPIASFTANPSSGTAPVTVSFTDTSTGAITSRSWDFNADGVTDDTGATPSHVFSSPGMHQVTLTVAGPGGSSTTSQTITVSINTPPAVSITAPASGASFAQGTPVTFSGIANDAEDGSLSSTIHWTSNVDGSLGDGASIQATNLTVGSHTISASVVDSSVAPATASIAITVAPPPPPPFQVVFNASPTAGLAPVLVSFNACASTGTILRFRWDFNNDGVDDQVNPCSAEHTYTTPGVYTAKLTVEESVPGGGQITMTKQILASSPPDPGDPGDCGGRRCEPPPTDDGPPPGPR